NQNAMQELPSLARLTDSPDVFLAGTRPILRLFESRVDAANRQVRARLEQLREWRSASICPTVFELGNLLNTTGKVDCGLKDETVLQIVGAAMHLEYVDQELKSLEG